MERSSGGINKNNSHIQRAMPENDSQNQEKLKKQTQSENGKVRTITQDTDNALFLEPENLEHEFDKLAFKHVKKDIVDRPVKNTTNDKSKKSEFSNIENPSQSDPEKKTYKNDEKSKLADWDKQDHNQQINNELSLSEDVDSGSDISKLFDQQEYEYNSFVSPSINNAAKILRELKQDPDSFNSKAHAKKLKEQREEKKAKLEKHISLAEKSLEDLRSDISISKQKYQKEDDRDHLKIQTLLKNENEETSPEKKGYYSHAIKEIEAEITKREQSLATNIEAEARLENQIKHLKTEHKLTDPHRRRKQYLQETSAEARNKARISELEQYQEKINGAAKFAKAKIMAKKERLNLHDQSIIDKQNNYTALLKKLYTADNSEIEEAINYFENKNKKYSVEFQQQSEKLSVLDKHIINYRYILHPEEANGKYFVDAKNPDSTTEIPDHLLSKTPQQINQIRKNSGLKEKDLTVAKEEYATIEARRNDLSVKMDGYNGLLTQLYNVLMTPDSNENYGLIDASEYAPLLQEDNELLKRQIAQREKVAESINTAIDLKAETMVRDRKDAGFEIDSHSDFWKVPTGGVQADADMPFTFTPSEGIGPEHNNFNRELPFESSENEEFSDSAPLLNRAQLLDDYGRPMYEYKSTDVLKSRDELAKEQALADIYNKNKAPEDQITVDSYKRVYTHEQEANILRLEKGKEPVMEYEYELDYTKPLYGYDNNSKPQSVNKKKLKEYKAKVMISHLVKTFFKNSGVKLRNAFSFFKLRTPGAKIERAIEQMARNSKNIFSKALGNRTFFNLFRDVYSERFKKDVTGLQRFHDLVGISLEGKVNFSDKEHDNGYDTAMTTLVMVGAGLIDARNKEGEVFDYRLLDSPAEQIAGKRLSPSATLEQRDQLLLIAKQHEGRKLTGKIKSKHLARAGKLMAEAVKAKKKTEKSNAKAIADKRFDDIRDADEVAKQKLIEVVVAKAGKRVPDDLKHKLEIMRDNITDELPSSDAMDYVESPAIKFNRSMLVPTEENITDLKAEIAEIELKLRNPEIKVNAAALRNIKLAKKREALEIELNMMQKTMDKHQITVAKTRANIEKSLSETHILTENSRKVVTNGILAHCGMMIPEHASSAVDVSTYIPAKLKIHKHQKDVAIEMANDVRDYLKSGKATGTGIYSILTKTPPLSGIDKGGKEFTKETPPHPLHATTLKSQIANTLSQEDMASHENRSDSKVDHEILSQYVRNILTKSGRTYQKDNTTMNHELLNILSMHVMVGANVARFENDKAGASSGIRSVSKEQQELSSDNVRAAKQLANVLVFTMNKEHVTPKEIAAKVFPTSKRQQNILIGELTSVWVK